MMIIDDDMIWYDIGRRAAKEAKANVKQMKVQRRPLWGSMMKDNNRQWNAH
jgi:hypothetical protein